MNQPRTSFKQCVERCMMIASVFLLAGNTMVWGAEEAQEQIVSDCVKASMAIAKAEHVKAKASGPQPPRYRGLKPHEPMPKRYFSTSEKSYYEEYYDTNGMFVIFKHDLKIRLREGQLVSLSLSINEHEKICQFRQLFNNITHRIERAVVLSEEKADIEARRTEETTAKMVTNRNLLYYVYTEGLSFGEKVNLINKLNESDLIEFVEFLPNPKRRLILGNALSPR